MRTLAIAKSGLIPVALAGAALMVWSGRTIVVSADSSASSDFTLFGASRIVTGGLAPHTRAVDLTSNCGQQTYSNACSANAAFVFSGIAFTPDKNKLPTLSQIATLSTDYNMNGTDCSGGSPRFVIVTTNNNFEMNFGTAPFGGNCYYGWQNTGNVTTATDATKRWQVNVGNTFFTWSDILAAHGSEQVTEVDVVLDGGWIAPRGQDVTIDNFTVNSDVFSGR